MKNLDPSIFGGEPLAVVPRIVGDPIPSAVDTVLQYPTRMVDPDLPSGWIWRPYVQIYTFRTEGVPGTLRNVTISFRRQGYPPAGATKALQVVALGSNADQVSIFVSIGVHVQTFAANDGRGIPVPIDDSGPWDLWVGSLAAAPRAQVYFQIGYHPVRMRRC